MKPSDAEPHTDKLNVTSKELRRQLGDAEMTQLVLLITQMAERYPSKDLAESMEGILRDYEQLALRYSLADVRDAMADWRTKPNARFFPQPDEIATQLESNALTLRASQEEREQAGWFAEQKQWFWQWVDEEKVRTGQSEQEVLDSIKKPGYTGRKARGGA